MVRSRYYYRLQRFRDENFRGDSLLLGNRLDTELVDLKKIKKKKKASFRRIWRISGEWQINVNRRVDNCIRNKNFEEGKKNSS